MLGQKTILLIAHLCVLCMGSARPGWPGYDLYPELDGWLKVHSEPVDWTTARKNCHNEGALLASPWTAQFTTTINRLQTTTYSSLPVLYSGAGLRTGSPGLPMEPCEKKRCTVFIASGLDKVNCKKLLPYVCYAPAPPAPICTNPTYVYNSLTGQCYKLHAEGATVPSAKNICNNEGGYLAKINNDVEKHALEVLSNGLAFVDNDDGSLNYRHLFTTGYSDYECTAAHPFLCEATPAPAPISIGSDLRD